MADLPWNTEADQQLVKKAKEFTDEEGHIDWDRVSKDFPARTGKACESRWYKLEHSLTVPSINRDPTFQDLFDELRDNPRTLEEISNEFDRSPRYIQEKLEEMESKGYNLIISGGSFAVQTSTLPQAPPPPISIADLVNTKNFCIAIASDWHVGSQHSQPTRLNEFLKLATEEYGAKHVFIAGDVTDGAYVYGQKHIDNLIPHVRPLNRNRVWQTAEAEVFLANTYAPRIEGVEYFVMGGNHDRSIITNSGKDPIRILCESRDDFHYGGYDVWSIHLTDKSYIRLVHPSGGVAYARSYKLQKAIESLAFEALREAMADELPPMTSLLIMGHYHLSNHTPEPPLHGILAACFQGQTDYLKAKNLTPHIGGIIIELQFEKYGKLSSVFHKPILVTEIEDDWKNWPVPNIEDPNLKSDNLDLIFSFTGDEPKPPSPAGA